MRGLLPQILSDEEFKLTDYDLFSLASILLYLTTNVFMEAWKGLWEQGVKMDWSRLSFAALTLLSTYQY